MKKSCVSNFFSPMVGAILGLLAILLVSLILFSIKFIFNQIGLSSLFFNIFLLIIVVYSIIKIHKSK